MEVTPEDRLAMRKMAEKQLDEQAFTRLSENMVRSLAKRPGMTAAQSEAYVVAFFDVLMSNLLDVRNRVLGDLRRV